MAAEATTSNLAVSLRSLWPAAQFVGADDLVVSACTSQSRQCLPGDLFAALMQVDCDGHDVVKEAAARGASAILCERLVPSRGLPQCIVEDTRQAYGELCQALAGFPSQHLKVIGVTGTNGKTTTSCLIAAVLEAAGCNLGMHGTFGSTDGVSVKPFTTPASDAQALARWLAGCVEAGCTHAVLEAPLAALAQRTIAGIEFDSVCVTQVLRDSTGYHTNPMTYRGVKQRIFQQLAPQGFAVLNADDPTSAGFLAQLHHPVLTVGLKTRGELWAKVLERQRSEQTFLLHAGQETLAVRTRMIGDHHVYNCLQAAAVGMIYGLDLRTIVRGLEAVEKIPGHMERIECGQPFGVFVDYARTPEALASVLRTLRPVTPGRLICVFGAGEQGRQKRPTLGRTAEMLADLAILTTDNPGHADPDAIAAEVLRGCERPAKMLQIADREAAIALALSTASAGDCVVIAGKGHEEFQHIGKQRLPFSDRDVARGWLYQHAANQAPPSARAS